MGFKKGNQLGKLSSGGGRPTKNSKVLLIEALGKKGLNPDKMADTLLSIIDSPTSSDSDKLKALTIVIEQSVGKATISVDIDANVETNVYDFTKFQVYTDDDISIDDIDSYEDIEEILKLK